MEQLSKYKFNTCEDVILYINLNADSHRYIGREFIKFIGYEKELLDFISSKTSYDFLSLLFSYDEVKPLILTNQPYTTYQEFFTYLYIKKYSNIKEVIDALISYYTDSLKVLPEPYVINEFSSSGGFIKQITNTKKTRKIKKTRNTKKIRNSKN
jgi:uncharacterized protein YpbB